MYLSKSVQSVQSYRKCYKSRINIGVSCEPISKNNRCSTGAIGSASAAEPTTAQFFRLRGSSQWFTSERSGQQLGAVFQSQPDGAWKKSGRDRGLDSGDSLSVPSVEHAVSAQSYSYAYGVRLTVAISSSRIRTLAKARYSCALRGSLKRRLLCAFGSACQIAPAVIPMSSCISTPCD